MKNRESAHFGEVRQDREMIAAVLRKLDHSGRKALRRLRCTGQQGTVTLRGTVPGDKDRELAIEMARGCPRVTSVIDEIEVTATSPEVSRDAATSVLR